MAGESYTTKKILLKAVDGSTTQYFIPYVNNATADKAGLVKPDGTTITVDANGVISAQVDTSGLQPKIDSTHKLSADLISDGTTNKTVTATEKSTWSGKQDAISDLSTIRSNAEAGAGAASTIAGYGDIVTHDASEFLTEHQDISGKQDKIDSTHKLSADLLSEGTTNKLVSATEKSTWSGKQDAISDLSTIRSNAETGAGAASTIAGYGDIVTHNASEFAEDGHTHTKSEITDFPTIPTVGNAEIEIQKNGTKVDSFTTNQSGSKKTINITVPTSAADVSALPASTKYGATIDLSINTTTYVVTATLKDQDGTTLNSDTIDLPLETMVVSGSYDSSTKKVVLTLKNGETVEFSVADLISGLQTEITSSNKLSADLISDGTTNKTVTATEKSTWNGKQNAISDLSTIRSNAEAGAGAATTIAGYGDIVTHDASEFLTEHQDISGKQDKIDSTHKLSSDLVDDTNKTNKFVTSSEKSTWNGKQNAISDLSTIRSNAEAGAGAASTIAGYGDIVTHDASEFLTEHQDISGKQDKIDSTHKLSADLLSEGTTNKLVSATEKSTWSGKQDAISDLSDIRSNAEAGAGAATTILGYGDIVTHDASEFLTEHQDISGKADTADLATVATSGSYNDLLNKPTIPTVGNAEIEIQKNGTKVDSFTTNQSGSKKTINITVPTNNNQLTNGAGYITSASLPTKLSDLTDDLGTSPTHTHSQYLTEHQDISGKANTADLAAVATSGSYNDLLNKPTIPSAVTVDSALSDSSTNPVQNKVIKSALDGKQATISDLSTIRSNAEAGAGAATTISGYGDIVTHAADEFAAANHSHSNYVPTTRKVNSKTLSADITLSAPDVGAAASSHTHTKSEITDFPTIPTITDTYSATSSNGMSGKAVASAISGKADSATSLSGYGITDAYTKTEIDGMVSAGMHYKGSKTSYSNLPTTGNQTGDLWNVTDTGANYAWNGSSWDKMSENIDLSGYVPTSRTINSKALTGNISLTASDVGAATSDHTHSNYVPTSRTINSKALTADITLSASDVGALPDSTSIPSKTSDLNNDSGFITGVAWGDVTDKPSTFTPASHNQASSTINALTSYNKSVSGGTGALSTSDTLNKALAKLENALDGKQASGSYATTSDISDMATKTWVGNQGYTSNVGTVTKVNNTSPDANGNVTITIPSAVTETTVSGWGFTKNAGTVTSVNNVSPTNGNVTLSIPTVTDTYSATSSNAMSGKAVASAISGKADSSDIPTVPTALSSFTDDLGSSPTHTHSQYLTSVTAHDQASSTINALTGYSKSVTGGTGALSTSDTLNKALAKLENALDGKQASGNYLTSSSSLDASKLTGTVPSGCYTDTVYTHPTTAGNKHIPAGGSSGQILKYSADGTATWADEYSYTHPTTAGNKHIPAGGSSNQVLVYSAAGTAAWGSVPSHNQASSTINAMTSYSKASAAAAIATTDSLNTAVGKLEYKVDDVDTQLQALVTILNNAAS